uniref:Uncharacterized protein n=1 Tax=Manihot esculenta TaxID=3983 RepID=A0A2C9UKI3_MANES
MSNSLSKDILYDNDRPWRPAPSLPELDRRGLKFEVFWSHLM